MASAGDVRRVTLFFSDIEGSTRLLRRAGEGYADLLARHREIVRDVLAAHGGREQGTAGDSFFAFFDQAVAACAAAVDVHRRLGAERWPADREVRVRIGLHSGEIRARDSDWVGLAIHEGARIGNAAHGGQTLVSEATRRLVLDAPPGGGVFSDLGRHRLKDIEEPIQLYQLTDPEVAVAFPPPRSLEVRRHNLPAPVSSFVGRERELAEITTRLGETRLLGLVGPGGTGKSRLALEVAAGALDGPGDGIWLVELAPIAEPDLVASAVAATLGVREEPGRPIVDTLVEVIAARELLLILDNCEHLLAACARLVNHLLRACPRLRVLTTSRAVLGAAGEALYRVPVMPAPPEEVRDVDSIARYDSVRLFVERATASENTFRLDDTNAAGVASICRRLDGIPLAIELAAGRLRTMSTVELNDRLDERFRLLTGGSAGALERQQTLRATIEWSYKLLQPRARLVLDRLSVFAGGWSLAAAGTVSGEGELAALDVLGELVDNSLVQSAETNGATRFDLLESIRRFAAERLSDRGDMEEHRTRLAHRGVYLALAEEAQVALDGPDQGRWLERIDTELANLRTALGMSAADADSAEAGLRIAVALRRYWRSRGLAREGAEWLTVFLARLEAEIAEALQTRALICAGEMYSDLVDYGVAQDRLRVALDRARYFGDVALAADAVRLLSWIEQHQEDDVDRCRASADEAIDLASTAGDPLLAAHCLLQRANLWDDDEDVSPSVERAQEALRLFRKAGDKMGVARALNTLALLEIQRGDLESAVARLDEGLAISVGLRDDMGLTPVRINLGFVWILRREPSEARPLFLAALQNSRRAGRPDRAAYALLGLAVCISQEGRPEVAAQLHGAADACLEEIGITAETLEQNVRDADVDDLRRRLGAQFAAAYERGRSLAGDAAFALAMQAP